MALPLFVALAPALACLLLCVFIEGRVVARLGNFLRGCLRDKALLEMLAELTVHLSTYGSAVIGWFAHALFREETGVMFTLIAVGTWFFGLLRLSMWLRRLLEELRD